jgi:hypothetical protein
MNTVAIIILILAFLIVLASIFIRSFQELIFKNSQGEARIGQLSIKGVTFLVIVLALVAGAIYIETQSNSEYSINDAIEFLKKENTDSFSVDFNENGELRIFLNNQLVAIEKPNKKIGLRKGKTSKEYDLFIDKAVLGNFDLAVDKKILKKNEINYRQGEIYRFNEENFWFKLLELNTSIDKKTGANLAYYTFKFGEGRDKDHIIWSEEKLVLPKSDNGKLSNGVKLIENKDWKNRYIVSMGAGIYGGNRPIHIELIQSELVIIDIND